MNTKPTRNGKKRNRLKGWNGIAHLKVKPPLHTTPILNQDQDEVPPKIQQFKDQYTSNPTLRRVVSEIGNRL